MLEQLRADTPGCLHTIHLNNAGSSLPPRVVVETIHRYLDLEAHIGGYEAADAQAEAIAGFYESVARMLNAHARNIAFASSATDAFARAVSAIPFKPGDCILTTNNDYVTNQIALLSLQKRLGVRILRARDLPAGGVDVVHLEALIRKEKPALVSVTHIPTNHGLVQPVEAIGKICRENDCLYLVDACQSAGQMPLDVQALGCDFLMAPMRKYLRGPRGSGFLFVSDRILEAGLEMLSPWAEWTGPDTYQAMAGARRFEYFEMPYALVVGSKAAVDYAQQVGLSWMEQRINHLATLTRAHLAELPGVRVLDQGEQLCGIVTAWAPHWQPQALMSALQARRINGRISPGAAALIDFSQKQVPWALRLTPHYYNTEAEIEAAIEVLQTIRT